MRVIICVVGQICFCHLLSAQQASKRWVKNEFADSSAIAHVRAEQGDDLPAVGFDENERVTTIPSPLMANRDVLMDMAGFHFGIVGFRFRGYDARRSYTELGGLPMNDAEDGNTMWALWSGLNDVTRNTQTSVGLRANGFSFGDIGNNTSIDTRASQQQKQTQLGYAFSNRNFTHRISVTHNTGMQKNGWAYTVSGSIRYAQEGYSPGSFFNGKSYFIAVDRKINDKAQLSISIVGSANTRGRQSAVTQDIVELLGTTHYNAYWGYQAGKKRNGSTRYTNLPMLILRHDQKIDNHASWTTSIGLITGRRSDTGLDWYKAADPRPDYYRYLPGYQADPLLKMQLTDAIKANPLLLQVHWDQLIDINRHSYETLNNANGVAGNSVTGRRAHYIVEKRTEDVTRFLWNTVYHSQLKDDISVNGGGSLQVEETHSYKTVDDLLEADYYVDWNQYAEGSVPKDRQVMQNDLSRPDRVLHKGDAFGYNYRVHSLVSKAWLQAEITEKRWDHFVALEMGYTNYQREGLVRNGLFPGNSLGRSFLNEFGSYAIKAGSTWKINGRNYMYFIGGLFSRPPLFDNIYISPHMHDLRQEDIRNEKIISAETGYLWNTPVIKFRGTLFLSSFSDGMKMTSFYHDGYQNFVNYAVSGIGQLHMGTELAANIILSEHLSFNAVASIAGYYYSTRQLATVTVDNDASVIAREIIYAKNYRVAGTPQESYGAGWNWQFSRFYGNITASYFRKQWIEFNPIRRTYAAVSDLTEGSDKWNQVLNQAVLPDQYVIDVSLGTSSRIRLVNKHNSMLLAYVGVGNLLNNQRIIAGGYEQLRFDTETKDIARFPPKLLFAMALNYSFNLTLRL